eukprot:gene10542-3061_t
MNQQLTQPWLLYQTKDGSIHYYNTSTKESTWKKPKDYNDNQIIYGQIIRSITSKKRINETWQKIYLNTGEQFYFNTKQKISQWNSPKEEEEVETPLQNIQKFQSLLSESKITKHMTWEEAIPFVCFDERYLLIPKNERKKIFEDFLKEEIQNSKSKMITKKKESIEKFKELLKEIPIDNTLNYYSFTQKYSKDQRFNLLSNADRETLFKEYYVPLQGKIEQKQVVDEHLIKEFLIDLENQISYFSINTKWSDVKNRFLSNEKYQFEGSNEILEKEFYGFLFEKFEQREESSGEDPENFVITKNPKDVFESLLKEFHDQKKITAQHPTHGMKFKLLKKSLAKDERFNSIDEDIVDETISNFIWRLKK